MTGTSCGPRALVLDDTEEMRKTIRRALVGAGYEVEMASSLAQARALDPGRFDVVLIDANLGAENGLDLVETLRSDDPAAADRCLVITGGVLGLVPAGVACLAKPFRIADLLAAVRGVDQSRSNPPASQHGDVLTGAGAQSLAPAAGARHPGDGQPAAWLLLAMARRLRAREHHAVVNFIHDGPIQAITAAGLRLEMMRRSSSPAQAASLDDVLKWLETAADSLRHLIDGPRPPATGGTGLPSVISHRATCLFATPVTVDADEQAAPLGHDELPVVTDIVDLILLGTLDAVQAARAHVGVRAGRSMIQFELTLTAASARQAIDGQEAARAWMEGLATAFGASARSELRSEQWRAEISLPRSPAVGAGSPG